MDYTTDAGALKVITTVGATVITSGFANIAGVAFVGTATGSVQFFAGTTGSASLTPLISFCGTTSAVAGGFSPMFLRLPIAVSGSGLFVNVPTTNDPNLMIFWSPVQTA